MPPPPVPWPPVYAVYHSPKIEKPIGFDINIRSTNCGNQVVSPRWYRLIYHYEYDHPSRPSWLLGGTLTLSSLLTRESAVAPYIYIQPHLRVSPHLYWTKRSTCCGTIYTIIPSQIWRRRQVIWGGGRSVISYLQITTKTVSWEVNNNNNNNDDIKNCIACVVHIRPFFLLVGI